jgi:hypothetical protein
VRVTVGNFRDDPMFRSIERVVADLLAKGNVVTPRAAPVPGTVAE